jgi:hypothetical protein
MMNQLIRCTDCDEIFLKSPFDQYPEYEYFPNRPPQLFRSIERDDFKDFLKNHRGHRLEDLQIIDDSFVSDKAYPEPIKISYFKATNGRERFVIKKYREKIDEPLRYQLIAGDYALKFIGIEIQSKEITRQLEAEFKAAPLSSNKIAAFLNVYRQIVEAIDISNLERIPEEPSNPLKVYYKLDDLGLAYLLRNCHNIFKGQDYQDIEGFIHRHKEDGVLLLKATYKIQITEIAQPSERAMTPEIRPEKRKIAAQE